MSVAPLAKAMPMAVLAAAITFGLASAAQAAAVRTFVASSGDDSNTAANCPAVSPCRSFAAAYGVTSSGGEIVALDPAGYGTLTITGPISIIGAQPASITVPANSTGITIFTGNDSDTVILRNLQINGGNAGNNTGIKLNEGHLILQNSTLKLLNIGFDDSSKADIVDSDFLGNGTAVSTSGVGAPKGVLSGGSAGVFIARGSVAGNNTAFHIFNPGQDNGQPNSTIYLQQTDSSGSAISVNVVSNGTMVSGSGVGCPCNSVSVYNTDRSYNYQ
jgi:hypothetical protein